MGLIAVNHRRVHKAFGSEHLQYRPPCIRSLGHEHTRQPLHNGYSTTKKGCELANLAQMHSFPINWASRAICA